MNIYIDSADQYTEYLEKNKKEFYQRLVNSIKEAIQSKKSKGYVCTIITNRGNDVFDIEIFKDDWPVTLEKCRTYFADNNYFDEAIDAYEVSKMISE